MPYSRINALLTIAALTGGFRPPARASTRVRPLRADAGAAADVLASLTTAIASSPLGLATAGDALAAADATTAQPFTTSLLSFDAGAAAEVLKSLDAAIDNPTERFEAATVLLVASFASKVTQSPLKREKARVKPKNVTKSAWRKGEVARWDLEALDAGDEAFAVAFLQSWAARVTEVGELRTRARFVPLQEGVRLLWVSRGPGYLSQTEERALEKSFERLSDDRRSEAKRAKSTYTYAARSSTSAVGGVDLVVRVREGEATLSMRRCGYSKDEPVKEGTERTCASILGRDVKYAFGARRAAQAPPEASPGPDPVS